MAFIPPLHMCAPPDQLYNEVWLPLTSAADTSEPIVAHMEAQVNDQVREARVTHASTNYLLIR
jgi:hypothetical protein